MHHNKGGSSSRLLSCSNYHIGLSNSPKTPPVGGITHHSIPKRWKTKAHKVSRYFTMEQRVINGFSAFHMHATPIHYYDLPFSQIIPDQDFPYYCCTKATLEGEHCGQLIKWNDILVYWCCICKCSGKSIDHLLLHAWLQMTFGIFFFSL